MTPFSLKNSFNVTEGAGTSVSGAATAAAGKTTFGLHVAHRMLSAGRVRRVCIVAPTTHIARQWAAEAVGRLGEPLPEVVVPALISALKDTDPQVRRAAAEALKKVDPEAAKKAGVQ